MTNHFFRSLSAPLFTACALVLAAGMPGCQGKSASPPAAELMCTEHGVPERFCTLCHPELKSQLLMCAEHGVPEEICTVCHPEAAEKYHLKPLCKAHGLPEHLCPKCHPELSSSGQKTTECDGPCAEECRKAKQAAATAVLAAPLPMVRLAGPDVAEKAGIETAPAVLVPVTAVVLASGEVGYDESRLAHVRPRVAGLVREVRVKPGDEVRQGQVLASIDSAELGQAKADSLAAQPLVDLWKTTVSRHQDLGGQGVISGKQSLEAQAELRRAEAELLKATQRLRNFGLDRTQLSRLAQEDEEHRNQIDITSPLAGTVVGRKAVVGEAVEPNSELFTVVDLAMVWINIEVFAKDVQRIQPGQTVVFRVAGLVPAEFSGKVAWIDTAVHPQTRTIRVRVEAENCGRLLRAQMFGRAEIQVAQTRTSLAVPRGAVQTVGTSSVVFVARAADQFEPRRVRTGLRQGEQMELTWADLKPGDRVATTGSFLLKTEVQKGIDRRGLLR